MRPSSALFYFISLFMLVCYLLSRRCLIFLHLSILTAVGYCPQSNRQCLDHGGSTLAASVDQYYSWRTFFFFSFSGGVGGGGAGLQSMNNMYNFVLVPPPPFPPLYNIFPVYPLHPPPPPIRSLLQLPARSFRPGPASASATKRLHLERPRSLQSVFTVCAPVCRTNGLTFEHAYWWEWYGCEKSIVKRHCSCK